MCLPSLVKMHEATDLRFIYFFFLYVCFAVINNTVFQKVIIMLCDKGSVDGAEGRMQRRAQKVRGAGDQGGRVQDSGRGAGEQ